MECHSYCLATKIKLEQAEATLRSHYPDNIETDAGVIQVTLNVEAFAFLFLNGTVVIWNQKPREAEKFISLIQSSLVQSHAKVVTDNVSYTYAQSTEIKAHQAANVDWLTLKNNDINTKKSISFAFAQAIKLLYFELKLEVLINKLTPYISQLTKKGHRGQPRKKIHHINAEIMSAKSEMNLISNFFYKPRFFWQHPKLEEYFELVENYMEVEKRINAINHRLDTLKEIFEMYNSLLENHHSHFLEVIIILLIGVEIVLSVGKIVGIA
jgi:uncharacterized Rmd1/YagE family protein